jgi:hypothetical protein
LPTAGDPWAIGLPQKIRGDEGDPVAKFRHTNIIFACVPSASTMKRWCRALLRELLASGTSHKGHFLESANLAYVHSALSSAISFLPQESPIHLLISASNL